MSGSYRGDVSESGSVRVQAVIERPPAPPWIGDLPFPAPADWVRHTWATVALAAGIHAKVVQERLGHANVGITLNIYSHVAPVMHEDAAEEVAALVRRSVKGVC